MSLSNQIQYNSTQYDRIRALGKGSFGTATVHRRRADCSLVVLKEIDLQRFKGEREKMSAINEARIMSKLNHVNIIKYHNAYITETKLIIEMEYASVGTLATYLTFQMQPLEEREILVIFRQIASGVYYLHSKDIIHLDLKMTNIFVTIEGIIKIGDFGIARYMNNNNNNNNNNSQQQQQQYNIHRRQSLQCNNNQQQQVSGSGKSQQQQQVVSVETHLTKLPPTSSHLGTLAYSSPERLCWMEGKTDFKSDIWSLGCILYELITSKPLFTGTCLPDLVLSIARIQYTPIKRQIMPALRETFEQMIARDPEERPNAKELLCITGQLLSRLQIVNRNKTQNKRQTHRFELSTEVALFAGHNQEDLSQSLNYLHSLVYQVRLDSHHIHVDRVNLPQTKRIKEICKGKSHYLVLTYDNIVYGWGSKTYGQLGACGLSSSTLSVGSGNSSSGGIGVSRTTRSARSSVNVKEFQQQIMMRSQTAASSPASSTQTIATGTISNTNKSTTSQYNHLSKQLVMSMLAESQPTTRPFILNELNHRKIIQVAAGNNFSVFLSRTGIVMTCGDGSSGCLGRGDMISCYTPCMVESLLNADVVCIASGPEHVVAVCGNGRAFAWGNSGHGRLGCYLAANKTKDISPPANDADVGEGLSSHKNGSQVRRQQRKFVLRPEPIQFEADVFIKGAFCGDKCTVFIDSENRCWACGENRFNKLGLDSRRRFKKNLIVDRSWYPSEIKALSKYKIVNCNLGKNHSTFISSEGKLIVFGQDIDHSYRLKSNIISSRDSYRRITGELQNRQQSLSNSRPNSPPTYSNLPQVNCGIRTSRSKKAYDYINRNTSKLSISTSYKQKLSKIQRQQMDSYIRKSRSSRKMPFDSTISSNCRPKFTLALTNDNRVYFWGIRSHKKENSGSICPAIWSETNRVSRNQQSIEPQLVANCSDECFIKIGGTNNSLMSSIETLGSDQPIIHAQDPRLMAKSLADLWILDYQPSSQISSSSSSVTGMSDDDENDSPLNSSYCSLSSCSQCCSSSSSDDGENHSPIIQCKSHSLRPQYLGFCNSNKNDDYIEDCMRHDAILEPQPIVSLYVPSMFNHNGCSLNLVDLFCFDDDRFYLILDTSIKLQQTQGFSRPPSGLASGLQSPNTTSNRKRLMSVNETSLRCQTIKQINESLSLVNLHQPQTGVGSGSQLTSRKMEQVNNQTTSALPANQEEAAGTVEKTMVNAVQLVDELNTSQDQDSSELNLKVEIHRKIGEKLADGADVDDDENNNHSISSHNNTNDHTIVSSSQGGVSLEEPRSLSTFATSLGNHIIVGPQMRLSEQQEQALHPLTFGGSNLQREVHLEQESESSGGQDNAVISSREPIDCKLDINLPASKYLRSGRRKRANKSESTTNCASNDIEETSSMPSWVRNEYIEHQNQDINDANATDDEDTSQSLAQNGVFVGQTGADSSLATDNNTCMSRISLNTSSDCSDEEHTATEGGSQVTSESDQTLGHEISSISSDNNLSSLKLEGDINQNGELPNGKVTISSTDKKPKIALVISHSHPNISELNTKKCSPDMMRRASILDNKQHANVSVNGQINNILDCEVYKSSNVHNNNNSNNMVERLEINTSTSHNNESIIYNGNNHHHLNLSTSNLLNSALSSRSNSHNPLIRHDSSPRSGFRNNQQRQLLNSNSHTLSESHLHNTGGGSYSESPAYFWPKIENSEEPVDNSSRRNSIINLSNRRSVDNRLLTSSTSTTRHYPGVKGRLSRRQSVTTEQLNDTSGPNSMPKTRATSSTSLASLRKSLVKLFC